MKKIGGVWVAEGIVVAVEPGGAKGARVVVETDERVRASEAARVGFVKERPKYRTVTFYMTAAEFAALLRDETDGCHDVLLGRRLPLTAFGGRRV